MILTVSYGHARHVVVTDEAIITVERRSAEERRQASTVALAVGGGVLGALLAAVVDRLGLPGGPTRLYLPPHDTPRLAEMTEVLTCWAAEVPTELAEERGWPKVEGFRPVTFYPRAAIHSLTLSRWRLTLTLKREAARHVDVFLAPWDYRKVRAHLTRAGYL
ncbi:MAG TPA: hypothetical protein VGN09_02585 [Vicinamibacteria bacterium]